MIGFYVLSYLSDVVPGGNLLLVADLMLIALTYCWKSRFKIAINSPVFLLYIFIMTGYCFASRFWAQIPDLAVSKANAMLFISISMTVLYVTQYNTVTIDELLRTIMYGGYVVAIYVLAKYGIRGIMSLVSSQTRLKEVINANTLGVCIAYSMLVSLYYILYEKRLHFEDCLLIPGLIMLVACGSRKGFLIVIIGIVALFVIKNYNRKSFSKSIIRIIFVVIALLIIFFLLSKLSIFSGIISRLNDMITLLQGGGSRSTSGWIRFRYNEIGLELFRRNPILGIGLGNSNIYTMQAFGHDHYLHNNYVEMLATLGLVGTALYYSVYLYLLSSFYRYRRYRDGKYDICLVIMVIRLIMDYGGVYFYSKYTYVFLLLFWLYITRLKKKGILLSSDSITK